MICPVCHIDMLVMEYQGVEVDCCHRCRGLWLDAGELEILSRSAGVAGQDSDWAATLRPASGVKEQPRKCTRCRKRMEKVLLGTSPGGHCPEVLLDRCPSGDGLWFDAGELREAWKRISGKEDAARGVLSYLGQALDLDRKKEGESA